MAASLINQYNLDRMFYFTECCFLQKNFSVLWNVYYFFRSLLITQQSEQRANTTKGVVVVWVYAVGEQLVFSQL